MRQSPGRMCPLTCSTGVQFGKTDDIVLKEIDFGDFENSFWISTNHTQFGYDCYQNEGKAVRTVVFAF